MLNLSTTPTDGPFSRYLTITTRVQMSRFSSTSRPITKVVRRWMIMARAVKNLLTVTLSQLLKLFKSFPPGPPPPYATGKFIVISRTTTTLARMTRCCLGQPKAKLIRFISLSFIFIIFETLSSQVPVPNFVQKRSQRGVYFLSLKNSLNLYQCTFPFVLFSYPFAIYPFLVI